MIQNCKKSKRSVKFATFYELYLFETF